MWNVSMHENIELILFLHSELLFKDSIKVQVFKPLKPKLI
jgi:hypothetical protein